ncbi:prenyltransferase [Microthyrium microscopicum]|uniref:Prenyltransferase n=1 Tax=Microthyrium microscopicum TaxID=703497 RepID=A0A6A6UL05_9PEZI|nr:prenyltransferase [Microthyrium microscopicum]
MNTAPSSSAHLLLGGNKQTGWMSYFPPAWTPYIQLTRLTSPAPILLIYLPHLFGIIYAATLQRSPLSETLHTSAIVAAGSVFFSNAAHIWNDIVDADIDAKVDRTRNRPIPRGAVTKKNAQFFAISQAILALLCFIPFPFRDSALYALPNVIATAYYPLAKRHTNFPQLVLGFCLSWGILIGGLAMGVRPFLLILRSQGVVVQRISLPLITLMIACTFWTIIYDTVYAHLDLKQDIKLSVGSTAVLFGDRTKGFLWLCLALMMLFIAVSGFTGGLGISYFLVSGVGSFVSLSLMITRVELRNPKSCAWWFRHGFQYTGGAIVFGLLLEYKFAGQNT